MATPLKTIIVFSLYFNHFETTATKKRQKATHLPTVAKCINSSHQDDLLFFYYRNYLKGVTRILYAIFLGMIFRGQKSISAGRKGRKSLCCSLNCSIVPNQLQRWILTPSCCALTPNLPSIHAFLCTPDHSYWDRHFSILLYVEYVYVLCECINIYE